MDFEMFPGTNIERRAYRKYELADALLISKDTLYRNIRMIEDQIKEKGRYTRHQKTLYPLQIEVVLIHMGFSEPRKSAE